ncbi:MAG: carbamoyltransferase C-terminal domain-containing protein [Patescibacteria group bacterium]
MYILGINCGHDATAALIKNEKIIAVVQEERKTRIKHQNGFPFLAIKEVLYIGGIEAKDIDYIAWAGNDRRLQSIKELFWAIGGDKFYSYGGITKRIKTAIAENTKGIWNFNGNLKKLKLNKKKSFFFEHHLCHASSAYRNSGFQKALILTIDGVGDNISATVNIGDKGLIKRIAKTSPKHSIGLLYQAVTEALGFVPVEGEYKTMGLAAYGDKIKLYNYFNNIISYENLRFKSKFIWESNWQFPAPSIRQHILFKNLLKQYKKEDIAASCQAVCEDVIYRFVNDVVKKTDIHNICVAGGVFLNVKANKIIREKVPLDSLYIHPDAGDGGLALGAALELYFNLTGSMPRDKLDNTYFGRSYANEEIKKELDRNNLKVYYFEDIEKKAAELLKSGKVIGWFQGRMEMGPRALGNRSVLADPRNPSVKEKINKHLKKRDWFVPFAPSILEEDSNLYIKEFNGYAPFMIMAFDADVTKKELIPAVVHVDNTLRPQIVRKEFNLSYWKLIKSFKELTGIGVVLNTSFNRHGLPMVESPKDAVEHLLDRNIDTLVIGNYIVDRP